MPNPDIWDFIMEGGDELLNSKACSKCGEVIYLDQEIVWIDKVNNVAKCPGCGGEVKIND